MPIDTRHPDYSVEDATKAEDAYTGNVKHYVPRLQSQTRTEYEAYVNRAPYVNATRRTADGIVGTIMRKPLETNIEDVEVSNDLSLEELTSMELLNVANHGKSELLVDFNNELNAPIIVPYNRWQLINWREDRSLFVLEEHLLEPNPDDKYELVDVVQWRELYLDNEGYYNVRVWRKERNNFQIISNVMPLVRGEPWVEIPFVTMNPYDITLEEKDPIIKSLVNINISHFQSSVDLEHGSHLLALPTPYVAGDLKDKDQQTIKMGSQTFLLLEKGSQAGFIEFDGKGLSTIRENMQDKQEQMATLGAILLTGKKGIESAEAMRIRSASESASLMNLTNSVEKGMRQALQWYSDWRDISETEVEFTISRDFSALTITPQDLTALVAARQAGEISQDTFLDALHRGELVDDVDEEKARLSIQPQLENNG